MTVRGSTLQRAAVTHLATPCPCCSVGGRSWQTGPLEQAWPPPHPQTPHWEGGCPCLEGGPSSTINHSPQNGTIPQLKKQT